MLILVIGGSGSGKSAYAERLALHLAGNSTHYYLATMEIWDKECRARVERHRRMRAGRGFVTLEQPRNLAELSMATLDKCGTILLEDLGNLAANELYGPGGSPNRAAEKILRGIRSLQAVSRHLVIVSNEVGMGGSEYAGETDQYLRLLGHLHQKLTQQADVVCEVVAGLPFFYKGRNPI